jgi:multicomponent Na+:H+ antiporter subunit A
MASSIAGYPLESHLGYALDLSALPIWLSVATWVLAGLIYAMLDRTRAVLAALERRFTWTWDRGFDQAMFGLIRAAGIWTRAFHHGRLELYLVVTLAILALVLLVPLWALGGWPSVPRLGETAFYEWGVVAMAAIGVVMVVFAPTRLGAIVALGVQGLAVALIFMLFGAPDLALTQVMVEVLTVAIFALVMTRLKLSARDPRPYEDLARDGVLALVIGIATSLLLLRVLQGVFDGRLSEFFARHSVETAHGRNIVNVILVDFRGLDTLGEITVVMTAGIAALALLRHRRKRPPDAKPKRRPRRKAVAA